MILLDTQMWVWWVTATLKPDLRRFIESHRSQGLAISVFSCWEVARKVRSGKLGFDQDLEPWMEAAIAYRGLQVFGLSPEIVIEANSLPGDFHKDRPTSSSWRRRGCWMYRC